MKTDLPGPASLAIVAALLVVSPALASELPEQVTFSEHVAPVLFEHCVHCHRPGDVAPMSLLSYGEARPWAKSIRKVVSEGEMPPWDADPRYGEFSNDISLSEQEKALLLAWVDQGAQQGDPTVMPAAPEMPEAGSWKMGREPDYVIELEAVDVPADGPDLFVNQIYGLEVPEGKWVQALELLPGNTRVLHHVVSYIGPSGMEDDGDEGNAGVNRVVYVNEAAKRAIGMAEAPRIGGVWVAGSPPAEFPPGMGHPLRTDQLMSFNMHYHPSGEAGTDRSKVGIFFGEGEMEKEITTAFAADPGMFIPAGAEDYREDALYLFTQDSRILSFLPHMHNRGKSMRYTLVLPDGTRQVLLDVPEYDYDWQNIYHLREPIAAPAGSFLEVEASWDNSAGNPGNPDPTIDVPWGDGTNNEMMVAFFDYVVEEGTSPKPVRSRETIETLLTRHAPEHSYTIALDGSSMGMVWGLVLPPEGEGTFYLSFGTMMFSTSIRDLHRVGDELVFESAILTGGGGTRLPVGFRAAPGQDGSIEGEIFFGQTIGPDSVESMRGQGRHFTGESVAKAATSTSSPAGP